MKDFYYWCHEIRGARGEEASEAYQQGNIQLAIEKAQVIIDLGLGGNGRTRVVAGGFLFNGNSWRQSFDIFDIRFFQLLKKLTGIGRKAFDIAPLALGINRVKGQ